MPAVDLAAVAAWRPARPSTKTFAVRYRGDLVITIAVRHTSPRAAADVYSVTELPGSHVIEVWVPGKPTTCLYMHVRLPRKAGGPVPNAWVSTILYDAGEPVDPKSCKLAGPPGTRWGAALTDFAVDVAATFGCAWVGLQDDSFVTKCGKTVPLTDYLQRRGSRGFYERRGFVWIGEGARLMRAVATPGKHAAARAAIEKANAAMVAGRQACLDSQPVLRCKRCGRWRCSGGDAACGATLRDQGKRLTADMDAGDASACTRFARETTCLGRWDTAALTKGEGMDDNGITLIKFLWPAAPAKRRRRRPSTARPNPPTKPRKKRRSAAAARRAIQTQFRRHLA